MPLVYRLTARDASLSLSRQLGVLDAYETLNVLTTRVRVPMAADDAARFFERFLEPLWTVMPSSALYLRALSVQSRYRYSFYDSLIIAAALEARCRRLLTEDLQAGRTIEGLTIVNPFARV